MITTLMLSAISGVTSKAYHLAEWRCICTCQLQDSSSGDRNLLLLLLLLLQPAMLGMLIKAEPADARPAEAAGSPGVLLLWLLTAIVTCIRHVAKSASSEIKYWRCRCSWQLCHDISAAVVQGILQGVKR
jgi:hypothetical protein